MALDKQSINISGSEFKVAVTEHFIFSALAYKEKNALNFLFQFISKGQ